LPYVGFDDGASRIWRWNQTGISHVADMTVRVR
jgi:hypothetical protein